MTDRPLAPPSQALIATIALLMAAATSGPRSASAQCSDAHYLGYGDPSLSLMTRVDLPYLRASAPPFTQSAMAHQLRTLDRLTARELHVLRTAALAGELTRVVTLRYADGQLAAIEVRGHSPAPPAVGSPTGADAGSAPPIDPQLAQLAGGAGWVTHDGPLVYRSPDPACHLLLYRRGALSLPPLQPSSSASWVRSSRHRPGNDYWAIARLTPQAIQTLRDRYAHLISAPATLERVRTVEAFYRVTSGNSGYAEFWFDLVPGTDPGDANVLGRMIQAAVATALPGLHPSPGFVRVVQGPSQGSVAIRARLGSITMDQAVLFIHHWR